MEISIDTLSTLININLINSQLPVSLHRSRSGRSHATLPVPMRLLQTDIHSFLFVLRCCLLGPIMSLVYLSLYTLHQSQERLCFLLRENPCGMRHVMEKVGQTYKKVVESSNILFVHLSLPVKIRSIYFVKRPLLKLE